LQWQINSPLGGSRFSSSDFCTAVPLVPTELVVSPMGINWYPGHMVKARREIQNNIKLVDITIILLDARAKSGNIFFQVFFFNRPNNVIHYFTSL
jgi:hypothetical protein